MIRIARHYSDGSFNVGSPARTEDEAIKRLSGSMDDDDTQLVEVEIRVLRRLAWRGLRVVEPVDEVRATLEQAQACILGDTPEDCTHDQARRHTVDRIRSALKLLDQKA